MRIPEAHNRESTFVSKNLFLEHWKCLTSGTFGQTFANTEDKRSNQDFSFYFLSTKVSSIKYTPTRYVCTVNTPIKLRIHEA